MSDDEEKSNPLPFPSIVDVLEEIARQGVIVPSDKPEPPPQSEGPLVDEVDRQRAFAGLQAFTNHHAGKRHWSFFMMGVMGALIGFQMLLLALVGRGAWDFTKYEWLLPLLLVQNLAQIVGLAHVIVKALFDNFKE